MFLQEQVLCQFFQWKKRNLVCSSSSEELKSDTIPTGQFRNKIDCVRLRNKRFIQINQKNVSKHSNYFRRMSETTMPVSEYTEFSYDEDEVVEFVVSLINDNKISEHKLLNKKPENIEWIDIWVFANFIMCEEILNILLPKIIELNFCDLPPVAKLNLTISDLENIQPIIDFLKNNPDILLTSLNLSKLNIDDAQLEIILNSGNLRKSLRNLDLSSCDNLQNINLGSLPNLENIDLSLDVSLQTVKLSSKFKDFNLKQKYPSTNFIYID